MIIDFHTHVFPSFILERKSSFFPSEPSFRALYGSPLAKLATVDELLADMDRDGVEKSVIFGFPWERRDHFRRHNDYVLDAVCRHPDRLIGLCCFHPMSPDGPQEAERCLDEGLRGVGELGLYQTGMSSEANAAFSEIMEICSRHNVPLLLHTNEPVGHEYAGKTKITLREIYLFLKTYPKNRIVLAHWGGGLFFYALMKREVRETLENVWFDTAASPYLYAPRIYGLAAEMVGAEKILLGSDYPLLKPDRYLEEMAVSGLCPQAIEKITGANAARLLEL
jgi:predicted TIM-barrel fold metal-dependent hydrolase